jgi:hypothetical protein
MAALHQPLAAGNPVLNHSQDKDCDSRTPKGSHFGRSTYCCLGVLESLRLRVSARQQWRSFSSMSLKLPCVCYYRAWAKIRSGRVFWTHQR